MSYRLEIVAATVGAVVLMYELVGARIFAPYFGTSIFVWTALIGTVLGALAAGNWLGGRLADNEPSLDKLARVLSLAAAVMLLSSMVNQQILEQLAQLTDSQRLGSFLGSLVLFAPAATILGVVSPYVAKLKISKLSSAGSSIGNVYAAGTFGSIAGTFAAGYWLIAWLGNDALELWLALTVVSISFLLDRQTWLKLRFGLMGLIALLLMASPVQASNILADIDSAYSRYQIVERQIDGQTQHHLLTDRFSIQSAYVVDQPQTVPFEYAQRFKTIVDELQPERVAVIGGGAFTLPHAISLQYPDTKIDAIEIDPELESIAQEYFGLTDQPNLNLIFDDGRTFLNQTGGGYDVLLHDAFSSITPPYQLLTWEAMELSKQATDNDGVVAMNIIAKPDSEYLRAVVNTAERAFAHVSAHQVDINFSENENARQNFVLVMAQNKDIGKKIARVVGNEAIINTANAELLTDNYAPVEQLIGAR